MGIVGDRDRTQFREWMKKYSGKKLTSEEMKAAVEDGIKALDAWNAAEREIK